MLRQKNTLVGVDIGTYSVNCVVLEQDNSIYQPRHKNVYYLSNYVDGAAGYPTAALATILRDFVSEHRIQSPAFCITMSHVEPQVIVRVLQIDAALPQKEMEQSLRYELQGNAMIDNMDDYSCQWELLDSVDGVNRVLAVAVNNDAVAALRGIRRRGWTILTIEPQVISLGRVVGDNVAILDLGHSGTGLFIYKEGKPCYIQLIEVGGKTFSDIIAREYPGEPETVNLKHFNCAVLLGHHEIESDDTMLHLSSLIEPSVRQLAVEVKRTLRAVEAAEGFSVEGVYFIGNGARLRYLPEYLSSELEHDLTPISLTDRGMDVFGDYSYTVAAGACLAKDRPYIDEINFVRDKRAGVKAGLSVNVLRGAIGLLLVVGLVVNAAMYGLSAVADSRAAEVAVWHNDLQSEIDSVNSLVAAAELERDRLLPAYEFMTDLLGINMGWRSCASDIMDMLPPAVPQNVMITDITLNTHSGHLVLSGISTDYSGIGFFAIAIERSISHAGKFVTINKYDVVESGNGYEFQIALQVH